MLGPRDLVLCAGTLPRGSFLERVAAAAEAGFSAISLQLPQLEAAREAGHGDAELRAILNDHALEVAELDPLMSWIPQAELAAGSGGGAALFGYGEEDFYAAAEALGARSINAVAYLERPLPVADLAEAFGELCDRAAERGLDVCLEFLPWTSVANLEVALEIAELADRPNGGAMLDTWHHFRSGLGNEALWKAPGGRILGVQLSDAPATPEADPVEETLHRRRLPGEGDIDLVDIVRALDAIGSPAPLGVEVFSDELAALPPAEVARRAATAARAVIGRARSQR